MPYHDFAGREIEDLERDNMRADQVEALQQKAMHLHWIVVGYVSEQARQVILEQGGQVNALEHKPLLIACGLPFADPDGYWSWSRGKQQHRSAVEYWNTGEIQMERLTLLHGPCNAVYYSAHEAYLIAPWEEWDEQNHCVKEQPEEETGKQEIISQPALVQAAVSDDSYDPFLDECDLP